MSSEIFIKPIFQSRAVYLGKLKDGNRRIEKPKLLKKKIVRR